MSTSKRNRSPADSEHRSGCKKAAIPSHKSDSSVVGEPLAQHNDNVQITVSCRIGNDGFDAGDYSDDSDELLLDILGPERWLERIDGFASVGQKRIAVCKVKLIRRQRIRHDFWVQMEEPSEATSSLAFDIFDRYGRLDREYCEHEIRKGSGVWGDELDRGNLLLFEEIDVTPSWRRQAVATKIVNAILEKARAMPGRFFAFAAPGCLTRNLDYTDETSHSALIAKQEMISKRFWRSLGFRRVGVSGWFAYTHNDSHPSRHLDAEEDWDSPGQSKEGQPIPESIRTILSTLSDPSVPEVQCIRQIHDAFSVETDALSWLHVNEEGNTMLHLAAMGKKAETVSYILSKCPQLACLRNTEGRTPLEALRNTLELQRTRHNHGRLMEVRSDQFKGFPRRDIACLAALTGTEIFDLAKLSDQDIAAFWSATDDMARRDRKVETIRHTLRLKYGCTCGKCIGGFLSPRMRLALLYQAQFQYDTIGWGGSNGSNWIMDNDYLLGHLAISVRQNMESNKSMRQGFTNMCLHIARCLKENRLPTEGTILELYSNVTSEWPPVTREYLQRGGTVAAVAMMIFEMTMSQDEWAGDGQHMEVFRDEIMKLPICRNDHEFHFVRDMCGYNEAPLAQEADMLEEWF
ncbi:hypothetical protein CIB48_g4508 [Xylaria polymorpha]|nr:hypothetical protein CIB48_g4508 [Xylaria polymorpha]